MPRSSRASATKTPFIAVKDASKVEEKHKIYCADRLKSLDFARLWTDTSLAQLGCRIVVFTEGSREKCDALLRHYELREHVDQIVEGPKQVDTFRRLARLHVSKHPAIVVGDQLDRDIAPAKQAGLITIYFPGGFRPKWTPDEAAVMPDYRIQSFDRVAAIVEHTLLAVAMPERSDAQ